MTKKKAKTPPPVVFSDTELGIIASAARKVWNDIAMDCLQALADDFETGKRRNINDVLIPRDQVIELVMDASRLEMELKHQKVGGDFMTRVETDIYRTPSLIEQHLTDHVFKHDRYGT